MPRLRLNGIGANRLNGLILGAALLGLGLLPWYLPSNQRSGKSAKADRARQTLRRTNQATNKQFYVSPEGSKDGDGSLDKPWDLVTALGQPDTTGPGAIIWLRGGTYKGIFTSRLAGSSQSPIIVRQYPGERAVLDGAGNKGDVLTVRGEWTIYQDFEVMNSDARRVTDKPGSRAVKEWRGDGITVTGPRTKLINLVIHDNADGIGFWTSALDSEVYGCLIYNNGWLGPDRGHGHGIYAQNREGTKRIVDVISFNNFGRGIQAYGTNAYTVGFHFEGNASFNNYAPAARGSFERHPNLFVGALKQPADRITVIQNYLYHPPGALPDFGANLALGFRAPSNGSVEVRDNYVAGGSRALFLNQWRAAFVSGNTFYIEPRSSEASDQSLVEVHLPSNRDSVSYRWDSNSYFDGAILTTAGLYAPFFFNTGPRRKFEDWKEASGFDDKGTYMTGRPRENRVFIRANVYEKGRANVIVYNWQQKGSVDVDLSGVLVKGARYEVRNAQNFFGPPVLTGVYNGRELRLPMKNLTVAQPIGYDFTPVSTAPEFAAFVILSIGGSN